MNAITANGLITLVLCILSFVLGYGLRDLLQNQRDAKKLLADREERKSKITEDTRLNVARRIRNFLEEKLSSERERLCLNIRLDQVPSGWGVFVHARYSERPYVDIRVSTGMTLYVSTFRSITDRLACSANGLSEEEIQSFLQVLKQEVGEFLKSYQ